MREIAEGGFEKPHDATARQWGNLPGRFYERPTILFRLITDYFSVTRSDHYARRIRNLENNTSKEVRLFSEPPYSAHARTNSRLGSRTRMMTAYNSSVSAPGHEGLFPSFSTFGPLDR